MNDLIGFIVALAAIKVFPNQKITGEDHVANPVG
jgi:hypothetical protein